LKRPYTESNLEMLENEYWGDAPDDSSHLIRTCHSLRKKRLEDFSPEDLRILIGQQIGIQHLVPLALTVLQDNPLAEGNFYEGDLLCCLLRYVPCEYWKEKRSNAEDLSIIIEKAKQVFVSRGESIPKYIRAAIETFSQCFNNEGQDQKNES
jgi:hypothetical protein